MSSLGPYFLQPTTSACLKCCCLSLSNRGFQCLSLRTSYLKAPIYREFSFGSNLVQGGSQRTYSVQPLLRASEILHEFHRSPLWTIYPRATICRDFSSKRDLMRGVSQCPYCAQPTILRVQQTFCVRCSIWISYEQLPHTR